MNVVIIDDEVNAIEYLCKMLSDKDEFTVVKTFNDSKEGLAYLLKKPCDVLFLDIDMPNISGIYIAEQIVGIHPEIKICFATGYDGYAVKAFELKAIDYFLKPYSKERLDQCLRKLVESDTSSKEVFEEISDNSDYDLDMICCFNDDNIMLLSANDIFYIDVVAGITYIHTEQYEYRGNKTLNFYEDKLRKKGFFRTHKCYLANLSKVEKFCPRINYTYDMYFRIIKDVIPVSRNKVKELKQFFNS